MTDEKPWQRLTVSLGLVPPQSGQRRSGVARVFQVEQDSSRAEVVAGIVISLIVLALVATRIFTGPVWIDWWLSSSPSSC